MIDSKYYRLYQINNSFDISIKELINIIASEYNAIEIKYKATTIDGVEIGTDLYNLKVPEFVYVTVNFLIDNRWTKSGGVEYCKLRLVSNYISIRWSPYCSTKKNIEDFSIRSIRQQKLQNLKG